VIAVQTLDRPAGAWIGVAILQVLLNVLDWAFRQEAVAPPLQLPFFFIFFFLSDAIDIGN